jgi:hypothetical protein
VDEQESDNEVKEDKKLRPKKEKKPKLIDAPLTQLD